ncbi:OmpA family protein [Pedobacter sp. BS3]|uniref:OmpA family protein n=1 Tax=Pedobacter sp. BS3 TaxID=2567937 RepID=UPI0011EBBE45|nr:OmpA family protein [Pedobacter sp. BS3]TZF84558.1 OmpA family protein [Pedobacter sp. BS3]
MKSYLIKTSLLASGVFLSTQLFAQDASTQTIKPFAPASSYRTWSLGVHGGVLTPNLFFGKEDFSGAKVDIGYGAYIKKQINHSIGIRADFLRGKLEATKSRDGAYSSFQTDLNWAGALSGEVNLANVNFMHDKSVMIPYITAGAGILAYNPYLVDNSGTKTEVYAGDNQHELYFPIGAGFKFLLSKGINLDLGYTMNFANVDNVDGYNLGTTNDRFGYGHIGLEFALGSSSKPQLAAHNPVKVMYDDYVAQDQALRDELAAEKANTAQQLADMKQQLNAALADTDGDGVIDKLDKCADTPQGTKVDGSGCPLPVQTNKVIITEEDRKVVRDAIQNLEFDFGKSTIRAKSYPTLDRVAELLVRKNFSLKLAGHTDNVGSDAANMKLSKDRAESVKSYLVSKGANASRIEAVGYGETQPIASNATAEGRQQNRRVEFTLY